MTRTRAARFFALTSSLIVASLASMRAAHAQANAPLDLRVEAQTAPLGIDDPNPRFSWKLDDARRSAVQTAYELEVYDVTTATLPVWKSGRVESAATRDVAYPGPSEQAAGLQSFHQYEWRVRTFDAEGKESPWSSGARFGLGALTEEDWRAAWINGQAPVPPARPGAIGYHSAFAKSADEFAYIQLDLGRDTIFDHVRLHPARPSGKEGERGVLFPLRFKAYIDGTPAFDKTFALAANFAWSDLENAGDAPIDVKLTTRYNVRYLRIVVEKMQAVEGKGFAFALGELELRDGLSGENVAPRAVVTAHSSLEEGGWSLAALTDGALVPTPSDAPAARAERPAIVLRHEIELDAAPRTAIAHASALGLYELRINGVLVGDHRLAPGWTDYAQRVTYQSHDVAGLLRPGKNVLVATLAEGWYAGRIGLSEALRGPPRAHYGRDPRFFFQLQLGAVDGTQRTVVSDANWTWSDVGQVRQSDLLDGEVQDLTRPANFVEVTDAAAWKHVQIQGGRKPTLVAQRGPAVRVVNTLRPVATSRAKSGAWIYDFGRNVAGTVLVQASSSIGAAGSEVVLRHAETLDAQGELYTANLRNAAQTDRFALSGGARETFEPRFTVHGFRYVEITGVERLLNEHEIEARVLSTDAHVAGGFECSDPMLVTLWQNIATTRQANWVALPTDCPQRDERLGWMGDALVFARTAMLQADYQTALTDWLTEVRSAQTKDGRFPDFAPHPFKPETQFSGAPGWADAGVFVPWEHYVHYRDRRVLRASYDAAVRWLNFVRMRNPDLVWKNARGNDYGDWLNADTWSASARAAAKLESKGDELPKDAFATAFLARSADRVARMAHALGETAAAGMFERVALDVAQAFRKAYVTSDGRVANDAQAAYALALDFELYESPEEARAWATRLAQRIETQGCLTTGFHSTHRALLVLSRHGQHALALRLARKQSFPSWGWQIAQGATSMWERWDGRGTDGSFQDPGMNSFSHYAFGALGEWMVAAIAGLDVDHDAYDARDAGPQPWTRIALVPRVGDGLTHAKAWHLAASGRVESGWRLDGERLTYECLVPPGARARLVLPARTLESVRESDVELAQAVGVHDARIVDAALHCVLDAGRYTFVVDGAAAGAK